MAFCGYLKQSTSATIKFGPFVDASDGVTLETGLATALDNATTGIRVSKEGGNYADRNDATAPVYDEMGEYDVVLSTTDTNTLGRLRIIFEEAATCLPVWQDYVVLAANVYDSLVGGGDSLDVNASQWAGSATAGTDTAVATAPTNFADLAIASGDGRVEANVEEVGGTNVTQSGGVLAVNTLQISGDATAADNAELFFDGTGYAGGTTPLNVQVSGIDTDAISAAALSAAAVTEITDDIMAEVVETQGSYTVQQVLSVILAVLAGETSGGGTTISTPDGVATRVAATVDASNNRTAMTLTPSS